MLQRTKQQKQHNLEYTKDCRGGQVLRDGSVKKKTLKAKKSGCNTSVNFQTKLKNHRRAQFVFHSRPLAPQQLSSLGKRRRTLEINKCKGLQSHSALLLKGRLHMSCSEGNWPGQISQRPRGAAAGGEEFTEGCTEGAQHEENDTGRKKADVPLFVKQRKCGLAC